MQQIYPEIKPGEWLGILGGGQLGRMFCHAAQSIGYKVAVLDPAMYGPAIDIADLHIHADYTDKTGLKKLSNLCKSITIEFENIPYESLRFLSNYSFMSPLYNSVAISQNRIEEKNFLSQNGFNTVKYHVISSNGNLNNIDDDMFPGILKTAKLGYDGKGQKKVNNKDDLFKIYKEFGEIPCILEKSMTLSYELSVIIARDFKGNIKTFPIPINIHNNGILAYSIVDEKLLSNSIKNKAKQISIEIANALDYFGVLCVEFFVLNNGDLVVNEIAPRPHNSGHYTIEGCLTSQFEQQVRIMTGIPLGDTDLLFPTIMLNILGDIWFSEDYSLKLEPKWFDILSKKGVKLHLYGKKEARKNRKMGHITISYNNFELVFDRAKHISSILNLKQFPLSIKNLVEDIEKYY